MREDLDVAPITGQPLEKVITLHVAVIVRAWHVRRIEIHEVESARVYLKDVVIQGAVSSSVIEDRAIVDGDLFQEMFFDRQPEISAPVLIAFGISGNGKDASRLSLDACANEG